MLAVLGLLGKSLLEKLIVRDSKRFEIELKATADAKLEEFRNQLQLRVVEHQVRFSRLHEKRAEVIAKLYELMVLAFWEAESFVSPVQWADEPDEKSKHKSTMTALVGLYRYFGQNRIYLPENVCVSLEKLIRDVRTQVINLGVWVPLGEENLPERSRMEKHETRMKGWNTIKQEIPSAMQALEAEFRRLLGASADMWSPDSRDGN